MVRLARTVAPGLPHHLTQRGNRRQPVFFSGDDYAAYRDLMAARCWAGSNNIGTRYSFLDFLRGCGRVRQMVRLARTVAPGLPHHLTQRGNRRQPVFFSADDYAAYRDLMAAHCRAAGVAVWAYCLMPNHVHLILVPPSAEALRGAVGEAHRRYTLRVHRREDWRGYLWQGRFASFVMDEAHLLAAARYVELNPVRAGLAARAADWPWSSARAHLDGGDDMLVETAPLLSRVQDWAALLALDPAAEEIAALRRHARTGRPLGSTAFISDLERRLGRPLLPRRRGRKPKAAADN